MSLPDTRCPVQRPTADDVRESSLERSAEGAVQKEVSGEVDHDEAIEHDDNAQEHVEGVVGRVCVGAGDDVQDRRRTDEQEVGRHNGHKHDSDPGPSGAAMTVARVLAGIAAPSDVENEADIAEGDDH